ncbi:MAG: leucine-rich repeat domain-containing protein, partial [Flavobacteriales bacterium]|nr:leucine-rich repeat domain-containing protein [Flavobacteriales bacterium]
WTYDNLLTTLPDFSSNVNLEWIDAKNNLISSLLDFSGTTALQTFELRNNKLDFSDAKALRTIDVIPSLFNVIYNPQDPFGTTDTFNLNSGDTLTLSIANQDSALSYQWYKGGIAIAGATDTLYTIENVSPLDAGSYTCMSFGTALDEPPMTHASPSGLTSFVSEPFIVNIPDLRLKTYIPGPNFRSFLNATYPLYMDLSGDSLIFDSAASFTGVFNCSGQSITDIRGIEYFVNAAQMDCSNNQLDFSDARELRMVDTISTLTTYTYSPQNPFGSPASFNLNEGDTLTLSITSQDSALSYQWFRDADTIAGATDTLLVIQGVVGVNIGAYTCRSIGTALLFPTPMTFGPGIASFGSDTFTVNIVLIPSVRAFIPDSNFRNFLNTTYPSYMVGTGDSLLVDSAAILTGTLDCSNQGIVNLTGIEYFVNVTQLNCSNNKLDFSDARNLRIIDGFSSITVFNYSPQFPFGTGGTLNMLGGASLTLSIASQDSALTYQWFRGADTIVGATDTLLFIGSLIETDSGTYTCRSIGTALLSPTPMNSGPGIAEFVSEGFAVTVFMDNRDKVFIPDTNFRAFLNTTYPTFMDLTGDSLVIDSAATLTGTLNVAGQNIADLTGVEYFISISSLFCSNNQLTSIPYLDSIPGLVSFYCNNNQLTSLPNLSNNTSLRFFDCGNNLLNSLPNLSGNTVLEDLYCSTNLLSALPDLSSNTALLYLYCDANQLTSLPDLSNNLALEEFVCNDNLLRTFPDFTSHVNLYWIECMGNKYDFSDARTLRLADINPSLFIFDYDLQNPFGDASSNVFCEGDSMVLSIAYQDSALSYQWFRGTDTLAGETDTILIFANVAVTDSGSYTCRSYGTALDTPPMINGFGVTEFVSEPRTVTVSAYQTVSFTALADACTNAAGFALSGGSPAGGTYSGAGVSSGTFDPSVAGAGTHSITYTSDSLGCSASATQNITVDTAYLFTAANDTICSGDSINIYGTFQTTAGTYYDSLSTANSCDSVFMKTLVVNTTPSVSLGILSAVCLNAGSFALSGGTPAGGNYSGTGVSGGNFDPGTAGIGTHAVTYTYNDSTGCSSFATQNIVVDTAYLINEPNDTICNGDSILIYGVMRTTAGSYFDTLSTGTCDSILTTELIVNPIPSISMLSSDDTICVGDMVTFSVIPSGFSGYSFYINSVLVQSSASNTYSTTGLINGDTISATTTTLGCLSSSVNVTISVITGPVVTVSSSLVNNTLCSGESVIFTASPAGGYSYEFFVNAVSVQSGLSDAYTTTTIQDADVITVTASDLGCPGPASAGLVMTVKPTLVVGVTNDDGAVCYGSPNSFSASPDTLDTYIFFINGDTVQNSSSSKFTANPINDGDVVTIIAIDQGCPSLVSNNSMAFVDPLPSATITSDTVCEGQATTLSAKPDLGSNIVIYTWVTGIGTDTIIGNPPAPLPIYPSAGTYAVTLLITDINACSNTISHTVTVDNCISIKEQTHLDDIRIYPNPNSGAFTIQVQLTKAEDFSLNITNGLGQSVLSKEVSQANTSVIIPIDLSGQSAGIYYIQIVTSSGVILRQIAVK